MNPLTPKSDQHLISTCSITAKSHIKVMITKDLITSKRPLDCHTNSPGQYHSKCMENSMKNICMYTDARM